ncbi:MAG TPA: arylsulfotransferase family protein [Solirubrobacteraceae bacterium]|nr:arylsulfotransferase family protein [Solirubrobacteraceae bacterium]
MKRYGLIVLAVVALGWVAVAVVLGSPGLGLSGTSSTITPSGVSPSCLPATLEHSATLPGTDVYVSPGPETDTASPYTQISFLGTSVTNIQDVSVVGSETGYHYGHVYGYFQGDGGSFVPDKPFEAGERVSVSAVVGSRGEGHRTSFGFRIATPFPTGGIPEFPNPEAPAAFYQSFLSWPGMHPPILNVSTPDRDPSAGNIMMTAGPGPGQYGPLIYTPQGRLVWFERQYDGTAAENLSVQRYEGQDDLTWWRGKVLALGFGEGEDIVMNSNYQRVATIHGGNGLQADLHDFQLAPDEVAYTTAYDVMRCNLDPVGGARNGVIVDTSVQEIDMKTGLVRWEWHALDHIGVSESHEPLPTSATPWDWFHLNSVDPEPNGDLLVSGRSTWAGYQLEKGSGKILWRLGGTDSSFAMGPGTRTAWQHDARMQPDGSVTFFDDGSNPREHYQSRGVRIALDTKRRTATLVKAYTHPSPLLADSQGNMQVLRSGNVVIGWGASPSISELSPGGELLFDAHYAPGLGSYRAFRFPWTGRPLQLPSVVARVTVTGDETAVATSWNGSTKTVSWRVLAGEDQSSITPQGSMPAAGFESSVILPQCYAYVAVQALDSSGQVLGTSATVRVQKLPPGGCPKRSQQP